MTRNLRLRRPAAVMAIFIGGLLLWLAPSSLAGVLAFALGLLLELAGLALERRGPAR